MGIKNGVPLVHYNISFLFKNNKIDIIYLLYLKIRL